MDDDDYDRIDYPAAAAAALPEAQNGRLSDMFDIHIPDEVPVLRNERTPPATPRPQQERSERIRFGADGAAQAPQEISDYVPSPYNHYTFEHVVEEPCNDPDFCFQCNCSQDAREWEKNGRYLKLISFINDNFDKISMHALCAQVQQIYNRDLRPYTQLKLPWRQQIIYDHIVFHAPSPRIMYELSLRQHNNILHVLASNGCFLKNINNPSDYKVNGENVKLLLQVTEKRNAILGKVTQLRGTQKVL